MDAHPVILVQATRGGRCLQRPATSVRRVSGHEGELRGIGLVFVGRDEFPRSWTALQKASGTLLSSEVPRVLSLDETKSVWENGAAFDGATCEVDSVVVMRRFARAVPGESPDARFRPWGCHERLRTAGALLRCPSRSIPGGCFSVRWRSIIENRMSSLVIDTTTVVAPLVDKSAKLPLMDVTRAIVRGGGCLCGFCVRDPAN